MKKLILLLFATLLTCLMLSSCSAKLFVIRPTLIDRITVENLSSGESAELIRNNDGSICKNEGHYVLSKEDEEMVEIVLENWVKVFELAE